MNKKIRKEYGEIIIGEDDITIDFSPEIISETQKAEIIGETDKYIVTLNVNQDEEGKITWINLFFTER